MKKTIVRTSVCLGLLALGALYLAKKTGLLEDDQYLYDEFESH
ncbi:methanol dehydrogenase [Enterococcus faecalis]